MIELADGIFIAPEHVTMIRETDKDKCLIYFVGQSALEGHLVEYSASQVAEVVEEALAGEDFEEDEPEEEEE
jgi:hypothetical protein